jgi:signal peptidase I
LQEIKNHVKIIKLTYINKFLLINMDNNQKNKEIAEKATEEKGFKKYLTFSLEIIKIALIALAIVLPIRYFLFQPFIVKGESMSPNFESGDYLIVDEISYRFSEPQRGDIVVFKYPKDTTQRFIKRIIGLPGETVIVKNGEVSVTKVGGENVVLDENYLPSDLKTYGDANTTLKADEYFVLGDNRTYSYDSRSWGVVQKSYIIGRAFIRLYPVTELSTFPAPTY